jgi:hypothetical protein
LSPGADDEAVTPSASGWTRFVDAVEPEELMHVLGEFHEAIGRLVRRFEATVGFLEGTGCSSSSTIRSRSPMRRSEPSGWRARSERRWRS